jgi:hypothetical protein
MQHAHTEVNEKEPQMLRLVLLGLGLCLLAGCGNVSGKPLPMVEKTDPTWVLVPDRLELGALPQ